MTDLRKPSTSEEFELCNVLIDQCKRGEITPVDLNAELATQGLRPVTGRPPISIFDPMQAPSWTLLMAVVWVAYRDIERVRDVSDEFRKHWMEWKRLMDIEKISVKGAKGAMLNIAPIEPASFEGAFLKELYELEQAGFDASDVNRQRLKSAKAELWSMLLTGKISANGLRKLTGRRQLIPAFEWNDLDFLSGSGSTLVTKGGEGYTSTLIARAELLAHFNGAPISLVERAPPTDDEVRSILRQALKENGGYLSQDQGATIVRAKFPTFNKKQAMALTKELTGNEKPGPKGPRKNRA
jgi:hypothetical protein